MKPEGPRSERSNDPAPDDTAAHPAEAGLWEQSLSRGNLAEALRRVEQNAGAAGIDGMSTEELRPWLHDHWPEVRSSLEAGTYRPLPVRRVMIPKPSGGQRMLGVPAAVDRLICQAIAQVLTPVFDPQFHPHSFGFRPGRSQHDAVERARQFICDGAAWCVDFDPRAYAFSASGGLLFFAPLLMILFREKHPRWWFDWNLNLARFTTRVAAYLTLMDDRYPSTDDEQAVHLMLPHPDPKTDLNRWLPLVKWLLSIPHYIVLFFLTIGAVLAAIGAWFAILFTGRYPRGLFAYVEGVIRWHARVES